MEQALRDSEARLAAFMENAPVGMYLKDLEGRYVLANPEMSKVFARPAAGDARPDRRRCRAPSTISDWVARA